MNIQQRLSRGSHVASMVEPDRLGKDAITWLQAAPDRGAPSSSQLFGFPIHPNSMSYPGEVDNYL